MEAELFDIMKEKSTNLNTSTIAKDGHHPAPIGSTRVHGVSDNY